MTHEQILNQLLATLCPETREGDFSIFRIQGQCTEYIIHAELINNDPLNLQYKIHKFEIKDI